MSNPDPMNVLVSLIRGYGLGDAVQVSVILQHLRKYKPNWNIDYQAEEGRHCVGRNIVKNTISYGQPYPSSNYDAEFHICLLDNFRNWYDRPNTHVINCLHNTFNIPWDKECGRYKVHVSDGALQMSSDIIPNWAIGLHFQGNTDTERKNLKHRDTVRICKVVEKLGYKPLLIDWYNTSALKDERGVYTTGGYPFCLRWGADAEMNCAVITQCTAFIGIDSGPAKCASATDTPSLVIWTGHHPIQYHDPAPNTTHLVPKYHTQLLPRECNPSIRVTEWFLKNYKVDTYEDNIDMVEKVKLWLTETLPWIR